MKSAIKTIEEKIKGLESKKRIWSKTPNKNGQILKKVKKELSEHREALEHLNLKHQESKTETCRIVQLHSYRIMTPLEVKEKKIKKQGVGIWICTNCEDIAHSM